MNHYFVQLFCEGELKWRGSIVKQNGVFESGIELAYRFNEPCFPCA